MKTPSCSSKIYYKNEAVQLVTTNTSSGDLDTTTVSKAVMVSRVKKWSLQSGSKPK